MLGQVELQHIRNNVVIAKSRFRNGITTIGKNALLDSFFRNQAQPPLWYCGLINNAGYTALNAADTMSAHAGWTELAAYDEADRPTWVTTAAAAGAIANVANIEFTISATGSVRGIFIASDDTKSGSTGTLWSTALLAAARAVVDNDVLRFIYTVSF